MTEKSPGDCGVETMSTRIRRQSLSGFEPLEERRVLTAAIFLGMEIEIPDWVSDDDIAQAREVLGGVTFTEWDLPVFSYGDEVGKVRDELADIGDSRLAVCHRELRNFGQGDT